MSKKANFSTLESRLNIAKKFKKASHTYEAAALVQGDMRHILLDMLRKNVGKNFNNIFEFGAMDGAFTRLLSENLSFKKYIANDIIDFSLKKNVPNARIETRIFDMNEVGGFLSETFDLIASNACMQWLNFTKILPILANKLNENGVLLFSSFGVDNLCEIREVSGFGLEYLSLSAIENELKKHFRFYEISQKHYKLRFESPLEIFRHLRDSGVNSCAFLESKSPYIKKSWLKTLKEKFDNEITYHAIFALAT